MMCLRALKIERRELLYVLGEEDETAGLRDEAEVTWHRIENTYCQSGIRDACAECTTDIAALQRAG